MNQIHTILGTAQKMAVCNKYNLINSHYFIDMTLIKLLTIKQDNSKLSNLNEIIFFVPFKNLLKLSAQSELGF